MILELVFWHLVYFSACVAALRLSTGPKWVRIESWRSAATIAALALVLGTLVEWVLLWFVGGAWDVTPGAKLLCEMIGCGVGVALVASGVLQVELSQTASLAVSFACARTLLSIIFSMMFYQSLCIPTGSMRPTLPVGAFVLSKSLHSSAPIFSRDGLLALHPPERGELIVFAREGSAAEDGSVAGVKLFVKRCVGLPGDTVEVQRGVLLVNGIPQKEDYLAPIGDPKYLESADFPPTKIPEGRYFLLGDNRQASYDSRQFGPIELGAMRGRVVAIYWPLSKARWL